MVRAGTVGGYAGPGRDTSVGGYAGPGRDTSVGGFAGPGRDTSVGWRAGGPELFGGWVTCSRALLPGLAWASPAPGDTVGPGSDGPSVIWSTL
jgi:hypothetical protein